LRNDDKSLKQNSELPLNANEQDSLPTPTIKKEVIKTSFFMVCWIDEKSYFESSSKPSRGMSNEVAKGEARLSVNVEFSMGVRTVPFIARRCKMNEYPIYPKSPNSNNKRISQSSRRFLFKNNISLIFVNI